MITDADKQEIREADAAFDASQERGYDLHDELVAKLLHQRDALADALEALYQLVDIGVLERNTKNDSNFTLYIGQAVALVNALKHVRAALKEAGR